MSIISSYKEVSIKKQELKDNKIINVDVKLEDRENIVLFTIRDTSCEIVRNAVIKIEKINKDGLCDTIELVGYVSTNDCGEIAVKLEYGCSISYKFTVYNTLI